MKKEKTKREPGPGRRKWLAFKERFGVYISPFLFALTLFGIDFTFRLVYSGVGNTTFKGLTPNTFSMCWSILFVALALILPGILQKIYMSVLLAVSVFLPLAHAVMYNVSGSFLLFSDLAFAEDGMSFMSVAYLGIPWQMYAFSVLWIILGTFAVVLAPGKQRYQPLKLLLLSVLCLSSTVTIVTEHARFDQSAVEFDLFHNTYDPTTTEALYTDFTNANECLTFCGNAHYAIRSVTVDLMRSLNRSQTIEKVSAYYSSHEKTLTPNEMTGLFHGKNVIFFLGESIDTWMIDEKIMPNLYGLQQKGLDFTDNYTPIFLSAATFNTEFSLNTGFYLPGSGTTSETFTTNLYPQSLPRVFRDNGYTANSYHELDGHFYNRWAVHPRWGYESYNDKWSLGFEGNIVLDTSLMEPVSYQKIVHDEPFLSFVITYSGHGPYIDDSWGISLPHIDKARAVAPATKGASFEADEETWSQYEHAIAHAMETDDMIGLLLDRLTEDGHIDDTIIVFYTDHYSKYLTNTDFLMKLKGATESYSLYHTPFFIYSHDREIYTPVTKPMASADVLPTLFNLMGFSYDPTHLAGSDAFSSSGGVVAFRDLSWYDGETYWTPDIPVNELSPDVQEKSRAVWEWLNASWDTVRCNYFDATKANS